MGGNKQQKKSSVSSLGMFNIFKAKKGRKVEDPSWDDWLKFYKVEDPSWDDSLKFYKLWPSDEDRGRWVAEPGIDRKASAYIAKIRASTQREYDHQRQPTPVAN